MLLKNDKAAALLAAMPDAAAIRAAAEGLSEYGYVPGAVTAQWDAKKGAKRVVCALNNADLDQMLAVLFAENSAAVIAGLQAAVIATGAEKAILYLPETNTEPADRLRDLAKRAGLPFELRTGFVPIREHLDDILHNPETLCALTDKLTGGDANTTILAFRFGGQVHTPVEVPFGTALSTLITMENVKAVCIGGRLLPPSVLAETITPDFPLGSGVLEVLDDKACIVQAAQKALHDYRATSCGKCTFCREGLYQLDTIFRDMTENKSKSGDVELSQEIAEAMTVATSCSLGAAAAQPALTAIAGFSDELSKHVRHKGCPVGACKAFVTFYIDPEACEGCGDCMDVCPKDCIEGKSGFIHMIDEFDCIRCGKCAEVCDSDAVQQTAGRLPKLPTRLVKVGKFKKR